MTPPEKVIEAVFDVPDVLYKYTKRKYAQAMLRDGVFLIGTLYDFRDQEKHGDRIGDSDEGVLTVTERNTFAQTEQILQSEIMSKFIDASPDSTVTVIGGTFTFEGHFQDAYVYCMSAMADRALLNEFKADTCVRIERADYFVSELAKCLKYQGYGTGQLIAGACAYATREIAHDAPNRPHPALLKAQRFSSQREVRAVFRPVREPKQILLTCPTARRYLTIQSL
jgi:hypothetical protein